jgi:hypothetical protein
MHFGKMHEFRSKIRQKWLRDCFLTHHKGHKAHEGLAFDGQNSCKSVKFVAEHGLKGVLTWLQTT